MTDTSSLDAKLDEVARQYDELNAELARPETVQDLELLKRLGREPNAQVAMDVKADAFIDLLTERIGSLA